MIEPFPRSSTLHYDIPFTGLFSRDKILSYYYHYHSIFFLKIFQWICVSLVMLVSETYITCVPYDYWNVSTWSMFITFVKKATLDKTCSIWYWPMLNLVKWKILVNCSFLISGYHKMLKHIGDLRHNISQMYDYWAKGHNSAITMLPLGKVQQGNHCSRFMAFWVVGNYDIAPLQR